MSGLGIGRRKYWEGAIYRWASRAFRYVRGRVALGCGENRWDGDAIFPSAAENIDLHSIL